MCGIAGVYFPNAKHKPFNRNKIEKLVDELLKGIEPRGRDATGFATMTRHGVMDYEKSDLEAKEFIKWRSSIDRQTKTILLHTRFATKGTPKVLANNHPVIYNSTAIIHNGHISNDDELFVSEEMERKAEVDSEVIAALFHKYGIDKAHIPLQKLDGNYAVAVMDERTPNKLILAKGWGSPLQIFPGKDIIIWASTSTAIQDACEKALNFRPKWQDIEDLKLGELLYAENRYREILKFEPLESSWKSKGKGFTYTSYGTGWEDVDSCAIPLDRKLTKEEEKKDRKEYKRPGLPYVIHTGPNHGKLHVTCDDCFNAVPLVDANEVGNWWICDNCYANSDIVTTIVNHGIDEAEKVIEASVAARLENQEVIQIEDLTEVAEELDDELNEEHWFICELVADKFSQTAHFVDWLLFQSGIEDGKIHNQVILLNQYMDFSEAYDEFYKEYLEEEEEFSFLDATKRVQTSKTARKELEAGS